MDNNWQGYFLKIGTTKFPNKLIANAGIVSTPCQQTDKDSYVDGNGLLHRNILSHLRSGFKITTMPLTLEDKISISSFYSTSNRKKVAVTYWNDETNSYQEGNFYIPTVEWTIREFTDTTIMYEPVELEFIEY